VIPADASELLKVVADGDAKLAELIASATVVAALIRTAASIGCARH
jgi:hypothetical protein